MFLFNRKELLSLVSWAFFSFAVIRFLSIFVYVFANTLEYFMAVVTLNAILCFINYYIFKMRFGVRLGYLHYALCVAAIDLLITFFAYGYYLLISLPHAHFSFVYYVYLFSLNLVLASLLYLLTRIKKNAV
jgi:hypothetical protein